VLILLYNLVEPLLIALSLSVCMQLPMVSGLVYIVIDLLGILPLMLSGSAGHIKCKRFLCAFMLLITLASLSVKGYYYY
jgi:hypothetical protein